MHSDDEPNTGARDIAYNPEHHQKSKHISRGGTSSCANVLKTARLLCLIAYVNTLDNEADFFTKPLEGKLFFELRDRIMNVAPTAMGGLARSYRACVHGGVLGAVQSPCE